MDLGRIAVRALLAYIYLVITTRASGKSTVGQATPFDFLVSLIIGDLIDDALWAEVSLAQFGAAVGGVMACDVLTKILCWRFTSFYWLVAGRPTILLRDGAPDRHGLRREQVNETELGHMLRLRGVDDWKEVRLAGLDHDSRLSVLRHEWAKPASKADAGAAKEKTK